MAHTTNKVLLGSNVAFAVVTFTSYTQGGEQFTLAEFGLTGTLSNVYFLSSTGAKAGSNLDTSTLVQYIGGGKVMLLDPSAPGNELATTVSLNFQVPVLVTLVGS